MKLEERKIAPGSKLVYVCLQHPKSRSDKPGACAECGKPLRFKIESPTAVVAEGWLCPMHPGATADARGRCPMCGVDLEHVEYEKLLAVPFSAVIDTGVRKVVFLEKGAGVFDAVEVTLGARAGEYYAVLKGLNAGDKVVTAGAFLLDAEARLNPAAGVIYFGASGGETKK